MTCIKTGCHIFIEPLGEFAYGDAHEVDGTYIFRLVRYSGGPIYDVLHFFVRDYVYLWDRNRTEGDANNYGASSTLVSYRSSVTDHGYAGTQIAQQETSS